MKKIIGLLTCIAVIFCFVSCGEVNAPELWENATYQSDVSLGEGDTQFTLKIEAGDKSITITVNTNETVLGTALYDLDLINDPTFFDVANGIKADWNADSAYWMFKKGGEYMNWGVGDETIENGAHYELVYTK